MQRKSYRYKQRKQVPPKRKTPPKTLPSSKTLNDSKSVLQTTPSNEDLLLAAATSSDSNSDYSNKTQLGQEEFKLQEEIIRIILFGRNRPFQAVTTVLASHGHIMLFDEENGYAPE
ncbi:hypothetical protein V6N12_050036 [Hibiscus sabdariffa]|uniref:Uncharacterized protein n=1 Tax=Hibiscus sabdariffa TaxID=183260 RepID=A0ABR2GB94_9ROSI